MAYVSEEQKHFFQENGFLRLEQVFTPREVQRLSKELDYIIHHFADWNAAWRGPWRKDYVDDPTLVEWVKLVAINDFHLHSSAWSRVVIN